jgi:hypothetical protein
MLSKKEKKSEEEEKKKSFVVKSFPKYIRKIDSGLYNVQQKST